jgi:steroid 5-alpha reductase family enzyme
MLWLLKERIFPDRHWQQPIGCCQWRSGMFLVLALYWLAPLLLMSSGAVPPLPLVAVAIALNLLSVFLHFGIDAQKHFVLKLQPGLIDAGFFARSRNTNYLGELLIYLSFALLAMHWLLYAVLAGFGFAVFLPNMRKKDESLSRYSGFAAYRERSGLLLPRLLG